MFFTVARANTSKNFVPSFVKRNFVIPKSLITCFLLLSVFFGVDVGFTKCLKKNIRFVVRCFSLVVTPCFIVILGIPIYFDGELSEKFWFAISICQSLLNFLFLSFSKFTIYDFIIKIYKIDKNVSVHLQKEVIGYVTCFYIFVVLFFKFSFYVTSNILVYYERDDTDGIPDLAITYISLAPDLMSVIFILVYYYIYCYIKKLYELVNTSKLSLQDLRKYYINLADCCDKIKAFYDRLLIIELMAETPKVMISVYWVLKSIKEELHWSGPISDAIAVPQFLIRVLMPAIMVEMVYHKVDAIKMVLHLQLLNSEVLDRDNDILRTLRYMDARDFRHKIWNFIPVDINLPLRVIELIVTYIIVIVQLTHLYD